MNAIEIEQNETLLLHDEVKLQARVLLPLIQALRNELGERPANRVVADALQDWFRSVIHITELGSPEVEFTRAQTMMHGASHCDFYYRWRGKQK